MSFRTSIAIILAGTLLLVSQNAAAEAILSTSDSQFTQGTDNQGWWSTALSNSDTNDNYFVGGSPSFEIRNFFTFDLSSQALSGGTIDNARLELSRYEDYGNAGPCDSYETVGLFDVATDAQTLNANSGKSQAIFDDLGTGTSYGVFNVPTNGDWNAIVSFPLNQDAIVDINAALGGYFSIGGALQSFSSSSQYASEYLFGSSGGAGEQRLIVCFATDPDTDGDGVRDACDNCPFAANADQQDSDGDSIGDSCDPCSSSDPDGDNACGAGGDNCPLDYNPDQADGDGDGIGDVCDNCPTTQNTDQQDTDQDGTGDVCDIAPWHDLAVSGIKGPVMSVAHNGTATANESITIKNNGPVAEGYYTFFEVDGLPAGCASALAPSYALDTVSAQGKSKIFSELTISCAPTTFPGTYTVELSAYVYSSSGAVETSYQNNSMTTRISLKIMN